MPPIPELASADAILASSTAFLHNSYNRRVQDRPDGDSIRRLKVINGLPPKSEAPARVSSLQCTRRPRHVRRPPRPAGDFEPC